MTGDRGQRRRRQDENEILDAARALFIAQGYHGTSMQQIADGVEFSVGKIYTLFPSKDALLRSLQLRAMSELRGLFARQRLDDVPPLDALLETLRVAFEFATGQLQLIRLTVSERLGRPQDEEESITRLFHDRVRRLLDQAIADGALRPLDTGLLTTMIVGAGSALVDELAIGAADDPYEHIPEGILELMVRPHLTRAEGTR